MNDLIERQALLKKITNKAYEWRGSFTGDAFNVAAQMVKRAPEVDATPILQAEWIAQEKVRATRKTTYYFCSNCNNRKLTRKPYCEECGAKMKGEIHK